MKRGQNNLGQVTIFIIIAVLIVAGITAYFLLRNGLTGQIPQNLKPAYDYYLSCVQEQARQGINLLGEQGGRIEPGNFVPGSQYMPFSSQLDFFGQPVPYWMYVSGNNILKEQVPTKSSMEKEIEDYIKARLNFCDFSDFEHQGFDFFIGEGDVNVNINDLSVDVSFSNPVGIYFEDKSARVSQHKISVRSKLGKFYTLALNTYNYEKKNTFLEDYALDVMRLYAPVTGTDISCAPRVFVDENIRSDLKEGLAANIGMLKLKGDYYTLASKKNEYFITDTGGVDESVNFIYSQNWPTRIEIYGDKIAEPVGLQQGLGILGFCYVPYHLIYDIDFPVLIQFYDSQEIFQFPIAVIIDKNQARQAVQTALGQSIEPEVCIYKNQEVNVNTYDTDLNNIDADIKFKCLNTECRIGKSENGVFTGEFPKCVNGFILASAEGYAESKYQISTNEENSANIIMNKLYNISLSVNSQYPALISFSSEDYTATVIYPEMQSVELKEGYYNVSAFIYKNSTLNIPELNDKKCVKVKKAGIAGFFGAEEEKCFDINIPKQQVNFAIIGGGKTSDYYTENMLKNAKEIKIKAEIFDTPKTLEEVQQNYIRIEDSKIDISLI